jgi:hypothetical protein
MRYFLFFILFYSLRSFADIPVFIGEKESFTANTGYARVGNSAAGIYNPAGLARITTPKLSVSATAFQNYDQKLSGDDLNATVRTFQSIPTQVTSTWKLGSSTIALSAFNTANYDFAVPLTFTIDPVGSFPARAAFREMRLLVGPSFARKISEKVDVGVSVLVEKRDMYQNTALQARFTDPGTGFEVHTLQQSEDKETSLVAVPILGFNYHHSDTLILGARLVIPGMQISGKIKSFQQGMAYVNTGANIVESPSDEYDVEEDFKRRTPAQIGIGINRQLTTRFRFLADIHHSFKLNYQAYQVGGVNAVDEEDDALTNALGCSLGGEYSKGQNLFSFGGLLSENPERNDSANAKTFYGVSGGWTTIRDLFESGVGIYYAVGQRKEEGNTATTTAIGLLLSTSYRF